MKFTFWYKKEVNSPSFDKAFREQKNKPFKFHSVETSNEEELESCIGFEYSPEDDD